MYGIGRHAVLAVLCLGPLASQISLGQAPKDAESRTPAPAAGTYPPIRGSGVVNKDDATKHILVVLNGLQGAKAGGVLYASPMPPFGGFLNDADIADIIDYQRSSWGNHGKLVTGSEVASQRSRSK